MRYAILFILLFVIVPGCITTPSNPSATQPATAIDPATTKPEYWWSKPGVATIEHRDFQTLMDACEDVARNYLFEIDRVDYRQGVLTTRPMTSKQFFEVWRHDSAKASDTERNSLATYRRTLRFDVTKKADGTYQAAPKILVERWAQAERRITSAANFGGPGSGSEVSGTVESDQGVELPKSYWYAVERDYAMEQNVAEKVWKKFW